MDSEQSLEDVLKLYKIKTRKDLNTVLKFLENNGFGYQSDYKLHDSKVQKIIWNSNKLNVENDSTLFNKLSGLSDYDEIKKLADAHFSQFSSNDKIIEYIKKFHIQSDDSLRTPSNSYAEPKDIVNWVTFKNKHKLKDEFGEGKSVTYYNFDKNYIKIYYPKDGNRYFEDFYKFMFNEECEKIRSAIGEWQNLGKIEIKFFQGGHAYIKGDISKFKEYYYNELTKKYHGHLIIMNNKKLEILKGKKEDW